MSTIFTKKNIIIVLILIIILIACYFILPVSLPLIFALLTALLLAPIVDLLSKRLKLKRNISVIVVFTLFVFIIGIIGYFLATKAITQVAQFSENLPAYINDINRAYINLQQDLQDTYEDLPPELVNAINTQVNQTLTSLKQNLANRNFIQDVTNIVTKIPSYFVTFLVYLIALFLFLLELPNLKKQLYSHLTEKTADKVNFMFSRLSYVFVGFFKAQFLVSIIIFIVSLIGLLIITPDVALIMSFVIWVIDVIPIIGSIVILAPWAGYHLIVGNYQLAVELLVLAAILLIIRRTVEPKVMGHHIGLSPLATLIAMYIGVMLFGVMGFIIGPLIVILFTSAKEAGIIKINFKI